MTGDTVIRLGIDGPEFGFLTEEAATSELDRTLVIPVAHTIFYEMGAERRASMGIAESLIRVSVGIEDPADLLDDFCQALESL